METEFGPIHQYENFVTRFIISMTIEQAIKNASEREKKPLGDNKDYAHEMLEIMWQDIFSCTSIEE
jgi:hypothetical protein